MIREKHTWWLLAVAAASLAFGGVNAAAQDDTPEQKGATDAADEQDAEDADDTVDDDAAFIRDGVFTPSETIEADSEISFPADI